MAHESAYQHYRNFLMSHPITEGSVLDVGGEGGEFQKITQDRGLRYVMLNMCESADINVSGKEYKWPIKSNTYERVISSSTLEHIEFPWETVSEMSRVCKEGGYVYINAPSQGPNHWDWDGWRFRKDSMTALAKWAGLELIHAFEDNGEFADPTWRDCVGIFRK